MFKVDALINSHRNFEHVQNLWERPSAIVNESWQESLSKHGALSSTLIGKIGTCWKLMRVPESRWELTRVTRQTLEIHVTAAPIRILNMFKVDDSVESAQESLSKHGKLSLTLIVILNMFKFMRAFERRWERTKSWQESLNKRVKLSLTFIDVLNIFRVDGSARESMRVHESWRSNEMRVWALTDSHLLSCTFDPGLLCYFKKCLRRLLFILLCFTLLYFTLLYFALLCFILLCFALLCFALFSFHFISIHFILFCFISFYFILFCFVLFCFDLIWFDLIWFVLFCFVLFCFVLFCFVLFCFVLFCFVLFCFVLFCFVLFYFILFYFIFSIKSYVVNGLNWCGQVSGSQDGINYEWCPGYDQNCDRSTPFWGLASTTASIERELHAFCFIRTIL